MARCARRKKIQTCSFQKFKTPKRARLLPRIFQNLDFHAAPAPLPRPGCAHRMPTACGLCADRTEYPRPACDRGIEKEGSLCLRCKKWEGMDFGRVPCTVWYARVPTGPTHVTTRTAQGTRAWCRQQGPNPRLAAPVRAAWTRCLSVSLDSRESRDGLRPAPTKIHY